MKRLKQLEDENWRLKRIVADLTLNRGLPQDVNQKSLRTARRRQLVDYLRANWQLNIRRAREVLQAERWSYRYKQTSRFRRPQTPDPRQTMQE